MYIKNTLYIIFILTAVNIGGARGRGKFINYLHLNRVGGGRDWELFISIDNLTSLKNILNY